MSLARILHWIFPPRCAGCGSLGAVICSVCQPTIPYIRGPICSACGTPFLHEYAAADHTCIDTKYIRKIRSATVFSGVIRKALIALKYRNQRYVADALIGCCSLQWPVVSWNIDAIVPIPANRQKEKIRGYNQARLLAEAYSQYATIPLADGLLQKVDNIHTQVGLSAEERKQNIKNAFRAAPCHPSTLLLIDDVCTTGATMQSAARALIEAGAESVYGVTIARTILASA